MKNQEDCKACGKKVLWLSTIVNIVLALLKGITAVLTNSVALLADAVESVAGIVFSLLAIWGIKYGEKPSNKEHPYGYGKIEFIISLLVGVVLIVASSGILYKAIRMLFIDSSHTPPKILSFWVALLSMYTLFGLSSYIMCPAKELESPALKAVSIANRTDAYTCLVVVICLLGCQLGFPQLDPIGACIIGLVIFKMGAQLCIENYHGLLDASADPEVIKKMKETIISIQEVKGINYMKTRHSGRKIFIDLQIFVEGKKTVDEGNNIIREVTSALMRRIEHLGNVHVSLKPV